MQLPHWVEEKLKTLPENFTGQVVIECWSGGVTRVDTNQRHVAPKPAEAVRRALSA